MPTLIDFLNGPYRVIGSQHISGLNTVASAVTAGFTESELNHEVLEFVKNLYFSTSDSFLSTEMFALIPNAVNSYINDSLGEYTEEQFYFVELLLRGLFNVPSNSLPSFLIDLNDNIIKSELSKQEQIPLLISTAIAGSNYGYWLDQINTPTSSWYVNNYFDSNSYVNFLNLPHWVAACVIGTLSSANLAANYGQIDPPRIIGVDIVSALTGSLGLGLGKVMFDYSQKIVSSANFTGIRIPIFGSEDGGGRMGYSSAGISSTGRKYRSDKTKYYRSGNVKWHEIDWIDP